LKGRLLQISDISLHLSLDCAARVELQKHGMRMKKLVVLFAILVASYAHAIVFPPAIIPASPTAGLPFQFSIRTDECDFFQLSNPDDRVIQIIGNRVLVELRGIPTQLPPICLAQPGTRFINLPALNQGTYTLEVYRRELPSLLVVRLVQTADFTVGAPIVSAPALNGAGLIVMIVSFIFLLWFTKGKRI
jgi:hypothetical protein